MLGVVVYAYGSTSEVPWLFVHELEHGELRVPERDGDALAYGALLERGGRGLRTVMWHAGSIAVSQPVR